MGTGESSLSDQPAASPQPRKRAISGITAAISTLLLLIVAGWWTVAHFGNRMYGHYYGQANCLVLDLQPRGICLARVTYTQKGSLGTPGEGFRFGTQSGMGGTQFVSETNTVLGFGKGEWLDSGYGGQAKYVQLPYWPLVIALAYLPIRWLLARRHHPPGCCQVCGYDLRATPERCPECGTVIQAAKH